VSATDRGPVPDVDTSTVPVEDERRHRSGFWAAAKSRVAMTSDLLIALYVGLSVPVIGAGVALDLGVSAPNTVLVFAILVGLGVAAAGWALLGRRGSQVHP
jgi:hypothetical protein